MEMEQDYKISLPRERKTHRERQNIILVKERINKHLDCAVSMSCDKDVLPLSSEGLHNTVYGNAYRGPDEPFRHLICHSKTISNVIGKLPICQGVKTS